MNLFEYVRNNYTTETLSDADYDKIFTGEAAKYSSFKELEKNIDERLRPELTKWAKKLTLDRNKLRTLFNED